MSAVAPSSGRRQHDRLLAGATHVMTKELHVRWFPLVFLACPWVLLYGRCYDDRRNATARKNLVRVRGGVVDGVRYEIWSTCSVQALGAERFHMRRQRSPSKGNQRLHDNNNNIHRQECSCGCRDSPQHPVACRAEVLDRHLHALAGELLVETVPHRHVGHINHHLCGRAKNHMTPSSISCSGTSWCC